METVVDKPATTHVAGVHMHIEQGTMPQGNTTDDWRSTWANQPLNRPLYRIWDPNLQNYDFQNWPWVPGQPYYLLVTNTMNHRIERLAIAGGL